MQDTPTKAAPGRAAAWGGLLSLIAFVLILALTIAMSLPSNVLASRDGSLLRKTSVELIPQGWAFFTKPPSESEIVPFSVTNDAAPVSALAPPQAEFKNLLGLSRAQRAQGPELAGYVNEVTRWVDCASSEPGICAQDLLDEGGTAQKFDSTTSAASLCGTIIALETEPVRWSFREFSTSARTAKRAALLEVSC